MCNIRREPIRVRIMSITKTYILDERIPCPSPINIGFSPPENLFRSNIPISVSVHGGQRPAGPRRAGQVAGLASSGPGRTGHVVDIYRFVNLLSIVAGGGNLFIR